VRALLAQGQVVPSGSTAVGEIDAAKRVRPGDRLTQLSDEAERRRLHDGRIRVEELVAAGNQERLQHEYLSHASWRPGHPVVPGVLIVAQDGRVDDATPEMAGWLARLGAEERGVLPVSLRGLVRQTLDQRVGDAPLRPAKVRIRLPEGDWVVARAMKFTADATRTAVLMKSATRSDVGSLFLAVHGLTPREREITELLLAGADPHEVATCLHLSIHTVRSHLKTIFAKVGVGSRAELTASLTSR
jgi:DNA-binding CsgD family transcriptional regulator